MITMKNIHSFSLNSLNDEALNVLYNDVCMEMNSRAKTREVNRAAWVRKMCDLYLCHPNSTCMQIGEITVVSVYSRYEGLHMGKARPVNDDVYDIDVGIAVAFAKACNEPIPDYI
jgi:hypothetical protein